MPIFDYRCKDCSTTYDLLHLGKELIEDVQCPHCGSHQYTKLISLPGMIASGTATRECDPGRCGAEKSCCGDACPLN